MKQQNKKITQKLVNKLTGKPQAFRVGSRANMIFASVPYTQNDFKNALLIVSVLINVFVLTAWITAQVSSGFAYTFAQSLVR